MVTVLKNHIIERPCPKSLLIYFTVHCIYYLPFYLSVYILNVKFLHYMSSMCLILYDRYDKDGACQLQLYLEA